MNNDIQYILINAAPETNWTDDIPAIASGIIALLALFATIYQSHLSRKHNRLSVRPHLAVHSEENDNLFTITLRNDGLGPARIDALSIYKNHSKVDGSGEALIKNAFGSLDRCKIISIESINTPFMLPVGHNIQLVELQFTNAKEPIDDYIERHLRLHTEYCSIYGERFEFDSGPQMPLAKAHP